MYEDNEKRKYLIDIMNELEFFLPRGNLEIQRDSKYIVPLLFPKIRPNELILSNGQDVKIINRTHQWIIRYKIPFNPPSLWKILFLKLRKYFIFIFICFIFTVIFIIFIFIFIFIFLFLFFKEFALEMNKKL